MVQTKHIQVNPRMGIDSLCTLPSTTQPSYNAKWNMLAILDLKKKIHNKQEQKQTNSFGFQRLHVYHKDLELERTNSVR